MPKIRLLGSGGYIVLYRQVIKVLGTDAAVMLSEIADCYEFYEKHNMLREDGYFYFTVKAVKETFGFSKYKQATAIEILKNLGLIDVKIEGYPLRRFITVNHDNIDNFVEELSNSRNEKVIEFQEQYFAEQENSTKNTNNTQNYLSGTGQKISPYNGQKTSPAPGEPLVKNFDHNNTNNSVYKYTPSLVSNLDDIKEESYIPGTLPYNAGQGDREFSQIENLSTSNEQSDLREKENLRKRARRNARNANEVTIQDTAENIREVAGRKGKGTICPPPPARNAAERLTQARKNEVRNKAGMSERETKKFRCVNSELRCIVDDLGINDPHKIEVIKLWLGSVYRKGVAGAKSEQFIVLLKQFTEYYGKYEWETLEKMITNCTLSAYTNLDWGKDKNKVQKGFDPHRHSMEDGETLDEYGERKVRETRKAREERIRLMKSNGPKV